MLIRKHMVSGAVTSLGIASEKNGSECIKLTIFGKSSDGESSSLSIVIDTDQGPEISIIKAGISIARLRPSAQYTVPKQAAQVHLGMDDIPGAGFSAWVASLLSTPDSPKREFSTTTSSDALPGVQREARDRVSRRLRTLKKTYVQEEKKLPTKEELKSLQVMAQLLRSYLWMVRPEMFELYLDEAMTGDVPVKIPLSPDLSPGANLEALYTKIKRMERSIRLGAPRLETMKQQITEFQSTLDTLRASELPATSIDTLLTNLGLSKESSAKQPKSENTAPQSQKQGRLFKSSTGDVIILGRSATESDAVVKAAKSQDWWFHIAGGGHGSHVIVPGTKHRHHLPAALLREAAMLALHFSDRSESKEGEVYVSRRAHIKKRKGMGAGLWQIDRAETVVVRYTAEELNALFSLNR